MAQPEWKTFLDWIAIPLFTGVIVTTQVKNGCFSTTADC